jgi:hypothetical protein
MNAAFARRKSRVQIPPGPSAETLHFKRLKEQAMSENKRAFKQNSKGKLSTNKIIGLTLEVLTLPFLITVAVLFNMEKKNLGVIGFLLLVAICLFIPGLILSHLPQKPKI